MRIKDYVYDETLKKANLMLEDIDRSELKKILQFIEGEPEIKEPKANLEAAIFDEM